MTSITLHRLLTTMQQDAREQLWCKMHVGLDCATAWATVYDGVLQPVNELVQDQVGSAVWSTVGVMK